MSRQPVKGARARGDAPLTCRPVVAKLRRDVGARKMLFGELRGSFVEHRQCRVEKGVIVQ